MKLDVVKFTCCLPNSISIPDPDTQRAHEAKQLRVATALTYFFVWIEALLDAACDCLVNALKFSAENAFVTRHSVYKFKVIVVSDVDYWQPGIGAAVHRTEYDVIEVGESHTTRWILDRCITMELGDQF